jgi:hypothetical protein
MRGSSARFGILRGEAPPRFTASISLPFPPQGNQETRMHFDLDQVLMQEVNAVRLAAARTGFTVSQIEQLIECELDTNNVLDYISAVLSNRMN